MWENVKGMTIKSGVKFRYGLKPKTVVLHSGSKIMRGKYLKSGMNLRTNIN